MAYYASLVDIRLLERHNVVLHSHALRREDRGMNTHGLADYPFKVCETVELRFGWVGGVEGGYLFAEFNLNALVCGEG